ncbi:hypothetical protein V2J09_007567 [Rumex salicifolius]
MKGTETLVASELYKSPVKPVQETRKILGPGGNRARVSEPAKPASMAKPKKLSGTPVRSPAKIARAVSKVSEAAVRKNGSVDSSCSTESSSSSSSSSLSSGSAKTANCSRKSERAIGIRAGSVKPIRAGVDATAPVASEPTKRCDWITTKSDPRYISFHDEEWGVPICDDIKLFELLVLSIALAEHTWISILSKRDLFRALFGNFNPASVAEFSEEKLLFICKDDNALLSESKLRAVVENAKQILKVQEEFGSFSSYCWRFVNNQPTKNGYRYARQVPIKTPKSELISKDLMRRGFRCVGPTVVYSFMQVSGMVNDHLASCFRYQECNAKPKGH